MRGLPAPLSSRGVGLLSAEGDPEAPRDSPGGVRSGRCPVRGSSPARGWQGFRLRVRLVRGWRRSARRRTVQEEQALQVQAPATPCPPPSTAGSFSDVQTWEKNETRNIATSPHVSPLPGALIRHLSHRRFHVMLSALDPWVGNPSNPYVRHHWTFQNFWGADFRLHTEDRSPALPELTLQQCYQLPGGRCVSAGEWGGQTLLHARGQRLPQPPAPPSHSSCPSEQPKISVPWLCSSRAGVPAPPGRSPPAARCSQHAAPPRCFRGKRFRSHGLF